MRVVLDTNVLISSLISPTGPADRLYQAWRGGRFVLVTSREQLEEFRRVSRHPRLGRYLQPAAAGTMLNEVRLVAEVLDRLPTIDVSRDPADNFLLAMAETGEAEYVVTGDKHGLLDLRRHGRTHIVTVRRMIDILG